MSTGRSGAAGPGSLSSQAVPSERFSFAQVTPHAWEQPTEANRFVEALSGELCRRGHRVVVLAPTESRELFRESRATVRRSRKDGDAVFADAGCANVLSVGQSLPKTPGRSGRGGPSTAVSLPLESSRLIEEVLENAAFDFVHVHEPFAPSPSSAALRHSRALNVGTFHAATERVLSTQVARPLVKLLFGRLDGRTASFSATRDLVARFFPGDYRVIHPGADLVECPHGAGDGQVEILYSADEERSALRLFLRALRRLPLDLPWRATVWSRARSQEPALPLPRRLRDRVRFVGATDGSEAQFLSAADIAVAASTGAAPAPQLVLRALAGGAVPVASRVPEYEEALAAGERGLLFEPRDAETLAAQLARLVGDERLRRSFHDRIAADHRAIEWARVADEFEELNRTIAARRHRPADPSVRRRLVRRQYIHVDLHMHTDHSPDCATPV